MLGPEPGALDRWVALGAGRRVMRSRRGLMSRHAVHAHEARRRGRKGVGFEIRSLAEELVQKLMVHRSDSL